MKDKSITPRVLYVDVHGHEKLYQGTKTFISNLYDALHANYKNIEIVTFGSSVPPEFNHHKHISIDLSSPIKRLFMPIPFKVNKMYDNFYHYQNFAPIFNKTHNVVTIHDILPITHPAYFNKIFSYKFKQYIALSITRASHINCVSEYTKRCLVETFNLDPGILHIVPNGVDFDKYQKLNEVQSADYIYQKYGIKNYVIAVGRIELRKNIPTLLYSIEKLRENQFPDLNVVLLGSFDDTSGQKCRITRNYTQHHWVKHVTGVSDVEKMHFIRAAKLLVFPSLAEGFGIPPLEAMASGIPTVLSNCSAHGDIYRNSSLLFEPKSADDLSKKIESILNDDQIREYFIAQGYILAKEFNWKRSASSLLESLLITDL